MIRLTATLALVLATASVADAQVAIATGPGTAGDLTIASFDPDNAVAPETAVQGRGIKVGESMILHPVLGLETGFNSNVFYEEVNPRGAGVLRLLAQLGASSANGARLDPSAGGVGLEDTTLASVEYVVSGRVAYDEMLSGSDVVQNTGGLGLGLLARAMFNAQGPVSFNLNDNFVRLIRAANFETTTNANRDVNTVGAQLYLHSPGRTLSGYLYYSNTVDIFESSAQLNYPDRMDNRFGIHPMWRWLPETVVWGDVSWGVVTGIGSSAASQAKVTSYPLNALVGINTLLSLKTSATLDAGYANGFYSSGPSFSGPRVDAGLNYQYSPLGRAGVGYSYLFQDSVNANYFRDHLIHAYLAHSVEPLVVVLAPELHFREYNGVMIPGAQPVRDDIIFAVVAGVRYTFRNWLAASVDYRFATVQTDYRYPDTTGRMIDPSFARHEILAGVRVAW